MDDPDESIEKYIEEACNFIGNLLSAYFKNTGNF